jgi:hypothetical protein
MAKHWLGPLTTLFSRGWGRAKLRGFAGAAIVRFQSEGRTGAAQRLTMTGAQLVAKQH